MGDRTASSIRGILSGAPIKHFVAPGLFYLAMFCVLTWPLILKFTTHFFADRRDGLQNLWNIWWVNLAVRHPELYPTIWYTPMLHWPTGTTLIGHTLNPFNGYVGTLLLSFQSLTVALNSIVVLAFTLGGLTMYWLSYVLTRSFWGSLLAGFLFTFSSFHFMHAEGHLQLVSLEWIPLFVLCWYLLITRPGILTSVGAAVALWLVILCDYYYFFYSVLTAILIVVWYAVVNRNVRFIADREHLAPLLIFVTISGLLVGPILGTLLVTNYRDPLLGSHRAVSHGLDLLALVIPGGHWLFNQWTRFYWSRLPGNIGESSVYLALPVFFFMSYAWRKRRSLEPDTHRQVYLWFGILAFFFLLALGPAIQVAGRIVWDKVTPYTLLVGALPLLNLSGVPVRMTVMVVLCASILSAIGFRLLLQHFPQKMVLTISLLIILVFETLPRPLPATRIEVPKYIATLAGLPNEGGVVDMVTSDRRLALYYQTIHGKPVAFGYVSRLPTSVARADTALAAAIEEHDYTKLWNVYHIRYLVVRYDIEDSTVQPYVSTKLLYNKDGIRIYRIGCKCES